MMYAERAPSRQITGAAAVVAIHAALILALVNGLAERPPLIDEGIFDVVPVPDAPPVELTRDIPPVLPNPDESRVFILRPDIPIPLAPTEDFVIGEPVEQPYYTPPVSVPTVTQPSPLRSDPRRPLAPPDYPASAIRQNQQGTVQLLIYVLPNGRVGDVKINRSSGSPVLDAAAVRKAKSARQFLPATSGSGQAVAAWGTFDVRFELN